MSTAPAESASLSPDPVPCLSSLFHLFTLLPVHCSLFTAPKSHVTSTRHKGWPFFICTESALRSKNRAPGTATRSPTMCAMTRLVLSRILLVGVWVMAMVQPAARMLGQDMGPGTGAAAGPMPELHWRMIGPFRGGRTRAAAGVPDQPNVFYVGQVNGGVWKTDDYGRTWTPIFDHEPTQSIGAIAVARSDPNIIYVASGEGLPPPDPSVGTRAQSS